MDDAYRTVMIQKAIVSAQIEAMGMVAENEFRMRNGNQIAYGEEAFQGVIQRLENTFEQFRL